MISLSLIIEVIMTKELFFHWPGVLRAGQNNKRNMEVLHFTIVGVIH